MLFTIDSTDFSAITDIVTTMFRDGSPFGQVLLRVIDSEFVLLRPSEWVIGIGERTQKQAKIVRSGIQVDWNVFLTLVDSGYFNGFDEVWLLADIGSFDKLDEAFVIYEIGPYEAFDDSPKGLAFRKQLSKQEKTIGLLDGIRLSIVASDPELAQGIIASQSK
ncbi:MAG: hypothetical protein SFU56_04110 [Capsulimonadales bacterium]|nr:hypothetical protein [Capsulimonadales bacterium]